MDDDCRLVQVILHRVQSHRRRSALDSARLKCKQHTAPRTCHTRKHFSRVAQACISCHMRNVHGLASLLHPLSGSIPCILQQGVPFGRLAEQSPVAGYEPNHPVQVGSTEVTGEDQYRETRGDVLTQEKVKSRSTCFTGVFFRE